MIPKNHRFTGTKSIGLVYKQGKSSRSGNLSLKFAPKKQRDYQLAVVVSKKVSKSAVVRNRIRRRVFETIRKKIINPEHINQDLVITVYDATVAEMPAQDLDKTIDQLFSRAGQKF